MMLSVRPLKIGIGGVRGIVGETFTPELVVEFAQAFATYVDGGPILVGRDTRPSGPMLAAAVTAGLMASGAEVIDLGVCPTPTLQLSVTGLGAKGGISLSAGHNPSEWNALKFVRADGLYLNITQADELLDVYHQGEFEKAPWDRVPSTVRMAGGLERHMAALTAHVNADRIRERGLRVAVDCCNGACARLTPAWLARLGCDVLAINDDPSSPFPHSPEPGVLTAAQVAAVVRAGRADIGFLHDADGERLALVDETGRALSEEITLTLAVSIALQRRVGTVVTNVSTTAAIDRLAQQFATTVVRTPVGQPFISEAILANAAVIGGEGNGAVAVPEVHPTLDAAACIGLLLDHLASVDAPVSSLVSSLPALAIVKEAVPIEPNLLYSALQAFRDDVHGEAGATLDLTDGVKLTWPDAWVHVRASNTQSIVRIIAEADSSGRARDVADWAMDRLKV
jgi:phosphomannomutase